MKVRRVYQGDEILQTEVQADGGEWQAATPRSALGYDPPFTPEWEAGHARQYGARPGDLVLPFQPVSVRDFSPSEQHNIDAAHGYARGSGLAPHGWPRSPRQSLGVRCPQCAPTACGTPSRSTT
jgi:hypothetical protein